MSDTQETTTEPRPKLTPGEKVRRLLAARQRAMAKALRFWERHTAAADRAEATLPKELADAVIEVWEKRGNTENYTGRLIDLDKRLTHFVLATTGRLHNPEPIPEAIAPAILKVDGTLLMVGWNASDDPCLVIFPADLSTVPTL